MKTTTFNRREFVTGSSAALAGAAGVASVAALAANDAGAAEEAGPFQALGTRVGEVTDSTAIIWTRLTQHPTRNNVGVVIPGRVNDAKNKGKGPAQVTVPVEELEGACPGATGRVRVRYATREDLSDAQATELAAVSETSDFIHKLALRGLKAGTVYHYVSEPAGADGSLVGQAVRGKFETAPSPDAPSNLRFCVMSCQGYPDRGHADCHDIYPAMQALAPQFACLTGDLV
jgi:alkaline phosphatase D